MMPAAASVPIEPEFPDDNGDVVERFGDSPPMRRATGADLEATQWRSFVAWCLRQDRPPNADDWDVLKQALRRNMRQAAEFYRAFPPPT